MKKNWKYYLGLTLFIYSFLPYIAMAVIPFLGFSLAEAGTFMVIFVSTGEASFLLSAALLGKEFVAAIKTRIMQLFKSAKPPQRISLRRHQLGITMLLASFVPYYIVLIDLLFFSHKEAVIVLLVWLMLVGEALFMCSLFVLGNSFFDRLHHLLRWPGEEE